MTFLKTTEHFSGKLWTLRWRILVGKQKHNVQKHIQNTIKRTQKYMNQSVLSHVILTCKMRVNKEWTWPRSSLRNRLGINRQHPRTPAKKGPHLLSHIAHNKYKRTNQRPNSDFHKEEIVCGLVCAKERRRTKRLEIELTGHHSPRILLTVVTSRTCLCSRDCESCSSR